MTSLQLINASLRAHQHSRVYRYAHRAVAQLVRVQFVALPAYGIVGNEFSAHAGIPAKPNTLLLSKVGANKKCRFTSAEAYRAAWGDKPLLKDD